MKKCPYCAEEIQDEAIVCRYCGRDLVEKKPEPKPKLTEKQQAKEDKKTGCIALAVIGVVLVIIFALLGGGDEGGGSTSNPPKTKDGTDAAIMCQQFVKEGLKAPSTAKFQNAYQADTKTLKTDQWAVSSYVDAENSFGAMLRTEYDCTVTFNRYRDTWTLNSLDIKD